MANSPYNLSEHSFETALERLEQIVEEMEGDKLPLEQLLGRYEEGTRLVKVCQERIGSAEKRIELIARNSAGAVELADFDPSTAVDPAVSPAPPAASAPRASRRGDSGEVSLF
jgi:exodeoxyribonuclease VII small subunit